MSFPYYRVGQYYVDTSNAAAPVLYRCTTAGCGISGTGTRATWAQVSGGGGGGMNYRGVWSPGGSYSINDLVSLGTGTSCGLYLSLTNTNTNAPDTGIGWVQLSSFATWL